MAATASPEMMKEQDKMDTDQSKATCVNPTRKTRAAYMEKPGLIHKGEKMRVCASGLCFSGPSATI